MDALSNQDIKYILVTGGNRGIGKAICERLLEEWPDTYVVLGSRDASRGEQAVKDIIERIEEAKDRIECLTIDVSSDESVKEAAKQYSEKHKEKLYGIINNAGIGWGNSIEDTINVNYFGAQRVNDAFWPLLQKPNGRIVNVSSGAGPDYVESDCKDERERNYLGMPWKYFKSGDIKAVNDLAREIIDEHDKNPYGVSKALLNAYTVVLGKSQDDVIVNSCSPGFIDTDMTSGEKGGKSPAEGAKAPCWLMMDEDFIPDQPRGRFYGSDCVRSPLHTCRNPNGPGYADDEDIMSTSTRSIGHVAQ